MRPDRVTLIFSILLVAAFTSFLLHAWLVERKESGPPMPVITVGEVREEAGGYTVPFTLTNQGPSTAELVQVVASLGEESGEQVVDFLAFGEEVEGAFMFRQDPRHGKLTVRVASYKLP